jgi:hypothetical protein
VDGAESRTTLWRMWAENPSEAFQSSHPLPSLWAVPRIGATELKANRVMHDKATGPNRRLRFALGSPVWFGYDFCAPPASSAAVGEARQCISQDKMRHSDNRRVVHLLLVVLAAIALLLILQTSRREGRSSSLHIQWWRSPGTWNLGWNQFVTFSADGARIGGGRYLGLGPVMITFSTLTSAPPHFVGSDGGANGSQPIRSETNQTSPAAGSGG